VISVVRREIDEIHALLGYYAASSCDFLPVGCPETSARNDHYWLRNNPEERSSQNAACCVWNLASTSGNHLALKG